MIKCILIDDEPLALELLESHINRTDSVELLQSFTNPIEAMQQLDQYQPDLIFCDIQMPELTGVQFSKIAGAKFPIIFTTAYDQYAVQGYELDVIDYLLKPISLERFQKSVLKFQDRNTTKISNPETNVPDYIFVKSEYKTLKINLADIHYIKGMADYVTIVTADKKIHTLENLKYYEKTLPSSNFMRVHKSYILAMDKIEFIERNRAVILGDYIPISDTYKKAFFDRVNG
ncbi:two component transcriptional regulator, LytTR family [Nonlabens sp. Hel1_33_55]|uniref:LytR/AlgR family response regulator transcription factor n=1 Tax=Nonlabens sp. Hel1_33_55 TaxID=1336802 RepID=UPI000875CBB9|nr:LytTR family DNA-binding domain-containing protein [Nonlabens sp. Hel1_33_55]SCY32636.1 two component transcriptional regulator, LytTR family [Nonlabens sp. Hel1_33_55]